jgi:sporulation protein YlmC with PRC-barrel domain
MSRDPVSWLVVEAGWEVVGRDGEELGSVHEVIGDSGTDIFNGLAVSPGLLRASRYVPAERVREIVEGRVVLDLDAGEFARLGEAEGGPPSAEIRADTTDLPDDERP